MNDDTPSILALFYLNYIYRYPSSNQLWVAGSHQKDLFSFKAFMIYTRQVCEFGSVSWY